MKLLDRGYTTLEHVTCIERDPIEELLIRGALASYSPSSPVPVDVVADSLYNVLTAGAERAISRQYQVIDLDIYGRLEPEGDVFRSLVAAVDVQTGARVSEWVLLLTVEAASARQSVLESLVKNEAALMTPYGPVVNRRLTTAQATDNSGPGRLVRYAACVAACVVETAFPNFTPKLVRAPIFYRGSDVYDRPAARALMGAFPFWLSRPPRPIAAMGPAARAALLDPAFDSCIRKAIQLKVALAEHDSIAISRNVTALPLD